MQNSEFNKLLNENQWISKSVATGGCGDNAALVKVGVSPQGHRFISEFGFQAFSERLLAELFSADEQKIYLALLHDHDWILEGIQTGGEHSKPGIISWIKGLSAHRLLLDVNSELAFFNGHFPGNPILPGVVQLHWAVGISMSLLGFDEIPCEVKRLKFSNIVQPPSVLELQLEQKNDAMVQFQYTSSGRVHSMGSLVFRENLSC